MPLGPQDQFYCAPAYHVPPAYRVPQPLACPQPIACPSLSRAPAYRVPQPIACSQPIALCSCPLNSLTPPAPFPGHALLCLGHASRLARCTGAIDEEDQQPQLEAALLRREGMHTARTERC